jgi:hypothetical protein
MRLTIAAMMLILITPLTSLAQSWQSALLLDARSGYTSNTFLNPFMPEWDQTSETGYAMFAPMGQILYMGNRFSADATTGFVYEPFFDERETWTGMFGLLSARYRLSDRTALGAETGTSRFSTFTNRNLYWIQPVFTWSPALFTQLRFKAGSTFRTSDLIEEEENGRQTQRFDTYTIEIETWPDFRWQLRASLFGNLDNPIENVGLRFSADRYVTRNFQLSFNTGLQRYNYQILAQDGGGAPFPPITGPGGGNEQLMDEADRLLRAGTGAVWQVHRNVAFAIQADYLNYYSSAADESSNDFHVSAGVRFSIYPRMEGRGKANVEWSTNDRQTVTLRINHQGSGQLYILGDFNDWDHPGIPLSRVSSNRYAAQLDLDPGVYEYKILIIDGQEETWIDFSDETYTVPDGFGGVNGLIFID